MRRLEQQARRAKRAAARLRNVKAGPAGRKVPVESDSDTDISDDTSSGGTESEASSPPAKKARQGSAKKPAAQKPAAKKPAAKKPRKPRASEPEAASRTPAGQAEWIAKQKEDERTGADLVGAPAELIKAADDYCDRVDAERARLGRHQKLPDWFQIVVRRDKAIKNPKGESTDLEYAVTGRKRIDYLARAIFTDESRAWKTDDEQRL